MPCSKPNRKSDILNFRSNFCPIIAINRGRTLTNSSKRLHQIHLKLDQCVSQPLTIKCCQKLEFSSKGVATVRRRISGFVKKQ